MHILLLPSWYKTPENPGSGIFFFEQANALSLLGHQVSIVYYENRGLRHFSFNKLRNNHFQIVENKNHNVLEFCMKGWNPLAQIKLGRILWKYLLYKTILNYIKKYGIPDIIHLHSIFWAGSVAQRISKEKGIPYFITEHSSLWYSPKIYKYKKEITPILTNATKIFAVSSSLKKYMNIIIPNIDIIIIFNFINIDYFFSTQKNSLKKNNFTFFSLGNLIETKGFDILLKAFSLAFSERENIKLRIGGIGKLENKLKELSHSLNIDNQVTFLGFLTKKEVCKEMNNSNAFILLSKFETFGIVYAEAMACGKPVIATKCGGPEDFITSECGYLINSENVNEAAKAMISIEQNINHFNKEKIRDYVEEKLSSSKLAKKLELYYANKI